MPKVIGKICLYCGRPGLIVLETDTRIVYECANGHEYETKKNRIDGIWRSKPPAMTARETKQSKE
jgi:hypothetical protein